MRRFFMILTLVVCALFGTATAASATVYIIVDSVGTLCGMGSDNDGMDRAVITYVDRCV